MSDLEARDLRSESHAYKRAKNASAKYNLGKRVLVRDVATPALGPGHIDIDTPREHFKKTRPADIVHLLKVRHYKTDNTVQLSDPKDERPDIPLSSTLIEVVAEREHSDIDILYSFDDQGKSPNENGREVGLDKLVDRAEEEWENGQTDRMVKEYEVLDRKGGKTHLSGKKGNMRGRQSQGESEAAEDEDDGFEVI